MEKFTGFKRSTVHILTLYGVCLAIMCVCIPFVYLMSLIPYGNIERGPQDYFSRDAVLITFILATTSFGPVYLGYVVYLMAGLQRMLKGKMFHSLLFHAAFWPVFYTLLCSVGGWDFWFYYFDFAWFLLAFVPIGFHAAYLVLWNPSEDNPKMPMMDHGEPTKLEVEEPNSSRQFTLFSRTFKLPSNIKLSRRMRLALMFSISELVVIASALLYSFFLFPLYTRLGSDSWKALWRILLHPLWFEITMILPQRVIAMKELRGTSVWRFVPIMHSLFHSATIGRMLINNISHPTVTIVVSIISNFQEILFRLTAYKRDFIALKILYGDTPEELSTLHATILNVETILEVLAIITAPFMMYWFNQYSIIFNWYGGHTSNFTMFGIMAIQLVAEFFTDVLCVKYESKKFDVYGMWQKIRVPSFLIFLCYGYCSMGILGMIYTSMKLPRFVVYGTLAYCLGVYTAMIFQTSVRAPMADCTAPTTDQPLLCSCKNTALYILKLVN